MQAVPASEFRALILAHGHHLKEAVDTLRNAPEHWQTTLLIGNSLARNLINCFELADPEQRHQRRRALGLGRAESARVGITSRGASVIESENKAKRFREDMLVDYRTLLDRLAKNPAYKEHRKRPANPGGT